MCEQIWAAISNGGPGGRLAPPASKCHKKNVGYGGSHHPATDCVDWAYLSVGGVRTNLTPRLVYHTKKTKVPTLPQKSQKTKVVGKNLKSRHRLFNLSATQEKLWKKFPTNEGDFRCVPKKTNNAKKSAMKFRNIDIWMMRYLAINCCLSESTILFEIRS